MCLFGLIEDLSVPLLETVAIRSPELGFRLRRRTNFL